MLKEGSRLSSKSKRKEKKKHKKHKSKKHKKEKDKKRRRHHRSSSDESDRSRSDDSRDDSRDHKRRRRHRSRSDSSDDERRSSKHRKSKPDYYSRSALLKDHDPSAKQETRGKDDGKSSLGPDMALYSNRLKEINEMDQLRREKLEGTKRKAMTDEEREARVAEMQAASMALTDIRRDRSGYTAS